VSLRACTVTIHDLQETAHSLDVTAETLYEAVAQALAVLRQAEWTGEIGRGSHDRDGKRAIPRDHAHGEDSGF